MKIKSLTIILLIISSFAYGQIKYEKGYFVDNKDNRHECLMKNFDWRENPTEFLVYYDNSATTPDKLNINSAKEFGIYGKFTFIRKVVDIDRSPEDYIKLTEDKEPVWSREQLFLKILIKGKASLYHFQGRNLSRYFYAVADTSTIQLVNKKYLLGKAITYNNSFRQQLWVNVRCPDASMSLIENLEYTQKDLEQYFINYNKCFGDTAVEPDNKKNRGIFSVKIAPGLSTNSMTTYYYPATITDQHATNGRSISFGIETEYVLPYNNNKWGLLFEPLYQRLYSREVLSTRTVTINYSSIEFPLGLRYYMHLNNQSGLFVNATFTSGLFINLTSDVKPVNNSNFSFGGGFEFNRVSLEARYSTNRKLNSYNDRWSSEFTRLSFVFGFKIFRTSQYIKKSSMQQI